MRQHNKKLGPPPLSDVVERLRDAGYQPFYAKGRFIDWRRVSKQKLQHAKITVHPSGRVTVLYRSISDVPKSIRKQAEKA